MTDGEFSDAAGRLMEGESKCSARAIAASLFAGELFPGDPEEAGVKLSNDAVCCKNGERETYPSEARLERPVDPLSVAGFREGEPDAPLDVRRSSVNDGLRGVDPALTTFRVPDTFRPPEEVEETFRT
jgi:hypothetical protein